MSENQKWKGETLVEVLKGVGIKIDGKMFCEKYFHKLFMF